MVLNKLKLMALSYMQDGLMFLLKEVPACQMSAKNFHNRTAIEIPVFDDENNKGKKPDAILRGIFCKGILKNAPTIIFAMGQNQNVEEACNYIPNDIFDHLNIVLVNYRGYGVTNGTDEQKARGSEGTPSAEALEKDIVRVYDYVKQNFNVSNFYGAGLSLGSSLITYLSKERKLKGQMLITPFDSMLNTAYDYLIREHKTDSLTIKDVEDVLNHRFDSVENMKGNKTPTMIIRAGADTYVSKERTDNLVKHIKKLRMDITIDDAEHNFASDNPYAATILRSEIGTAFLRLLSDSVKYAKT